MTKSMFRYPGSKAKLIVPLMNYINSIHIDGIAFCDSFVGGGSVALAVADNYPKSFIHLNDKDYWIYSFWQIVAGDQTNKLQDLLALLDQPATLDQFYKLRAENSTDMLQCAYKAIFFNRTAFSGILKSGPIGGKDQASKYPIDCRYNAAKLKKKIINCNKLLNNRTIVTNYDIIDCLDKQSIDTTIYLDPPYVIAGKSLYTEYMTEEEHKNLAKILLNKQKWILSYDDCDLIRSLYKDCNIYNTDANYCINGLKTEWSKKNELIIVPRLNRDI